MMLCGLLVALPACALDLEATLSRDFGLTPGDVVESSVRLPVGSGTLDAATLPPPGRMAGWLDLRSVRLDRGTELHFVWQVLGSVDAAQAVALPRIELRTTAGTTVTILPARFHLSPVLPAVIEDRSPRPAPAPPPFEDRGPRFVAGAAGLVALLSLLGLLWVHDRLPGLSRSPGPLLRLRRALRRRGDAAVLDIEMLAQVHTALNEAAGQTLYPATLHRLFAAQPPLQPHREAIERFFAASWPCLFGAHDAALPPREWLGWLDAAALGERLSRRSEHR